MDALITAAARALAAGDALGALKRVALRDDPPALALRGIALAQLGEFERARELLRQAARRFGSHEALARARCVVAEAEVALAMRDLGGLPRGLLAAAEVLAAHGDVANAAQARLVAARRCVLLGQLDEAAQALALVDEAALPGPLHQALAALTAGELAWRAWRVGPADEALRRAQLLAARAGVPALLAEVSDAQSALLRPAAQVVRQGQTTLLALGEVDALLATPALVVDACRRGLGVGAQWVPLAGRPVLFALARALAAAWPGDVARHALIAEAFRTRHADETLRARLRVEIGRLRALWRDVAAIEATPSGYALRALHGREVVLLLPPVAGEQAALQALLSDGVAWSTSALALAMGASQRTVQRALAELQAEGRVRAIGQGRARRWLAPPLSEIATILLLPTALPIA
ncbi:MAG: helix-turn-helix domain-containing protein [Hydrogenophaga sp.]|uniref:helix-turn-helix domain-containing protein n=1 Tax=Hydrogenophaga sp. TaxID=1904254 RepID=UPI001DCD9C80|nr:helix-turn-helix domain-containing protein [Hydrogenophaga sp.]MBX3610873.1 helix-turn-helix domain-containing protein [Hydrogenophaga sp.]